MEITTPVVAKGTAVIGGGSLGAYGVTELVKMGGEDQSNLEDTETAEESSMDKKVSFLFMLESTEFSDKEKFGYAFGRFMFDKDGNDDKGGKASKDIRRSAKKENLSTQFQKVKEEERGKYQALKDACYEIYKMKKADVSDKLLADTGKYCSPFGEKPKTIKEKNETNYSSSGARFYDDSLISVLDGTNDKVGEHMLEKVLKGNKDNSKSVDAEFSNVNDVGTLKNKCNTAYGGSSDNQESDYGKSVLDFCSLDRSVDNVAQYSFMYASKNLSG